MTAPLHAPARPAAGRPPPPGRQGWSLPFAAGSLVAHAAALAALAAPWLGRQEAPEVDAGFGVEMVFVSAPAESAPSSARGEDAPPAAAPPEPERSAPPARPAAPRKAADEAEEQPPVEPAPLVEAQPVPTVAEAAPEPDPPFPEPEPAAQPAPAPEPAPTPAPAPQVAAIPPERKPPAPVSSPAPATAAPAGTAPAASAALPGAGDAAADAPLLPARASGPGIDNPSPVYPRGARRRGIEGNVLLDVAVSADGRPTGIEIAVSSGSSLLDDAAVEAVRRWRFVPARQGDRPVASSIRVPLSFRLTDG